MKEPAVAGSMKNFEVLGGLPGHGDLPEQFSSTDTGTHSEGFVVRFFRADRSSWIGNFQRGLTSLDIALKHPNGSSAIVVAGGEVYVVDVDKKSLKELFGGDVVSVIPIPEKSLVLFCTFTDFEARGSSGRIWQSRRISWDGIRNIELKGDTLTGEAWSYEDIWIPFSLDIVTGEHTGGATTEECE